MPSALVVEVVPALRKMEKKESPSAVGTTDPLLSIAMTFVLHACVCVCACEESKEKNAEIQFIYI